MDPLFNFQFNKYTIWCIGLNDIYFLWLLSENQRRHTLTCRDCWWFAWRPGSRSHLSASPSPSLTEHNTRTLVSSEKTEGQKHCGMYSGENTDQQDVAQAVRLGNFLLHWHVTHELHEVCGGNREKGTMKLKTRRSSDHSASWSVCRHSLVKDCTDKLFNSGRL